MKENKAYRLYSDGSFICQEWKGPEDTARHIQNRPGCALIINNIPVYYGIGVTDERIKDCLETIAIKNEDLID